MLKIVVLSSYTPSLFWYRMDMMQYFRSLGYEVTAIGNEPAAKWGERFRAQGICYRQAYIERNGMNPWHDIKTLYSLYKLLKLERPQKIFTFQAKTIIYGSLAARLLGIKEVYPLIAGLGSVFMGTGAKAAILRSILGSEYRLALQNCPAVFFQNKDDVQAYREMGLVRERQVRMLHGSGVNLEKFTVQPLPEQPAFLCIARLIRDKGIYEYLEACRLLKRQHPEARCMLVGPYDTNPTALQPEELQPFLEDGTIEYFGEQADVRPYLAACSVFVLPSYREGTPKANLEAMAVGRAIITTDTTGCRETVVDGENGMLVPVKDTAALADAMQKLLADKDKLFKMAHAGRRLAEQVFDVRKVNHAIACGMGLE